MDYKTDYPGSNSKSPNILFFAFTHRHNPRGKTNKRLTAPVSLPGVFHICLTLCGTGLGPMWILEIKFKRT